MVLLLLLLLVVVVVALVVVVVLLLVLLVLVLLPVPLVLVLVLVLIACDANQPCRPVLWRCSTYLKPRVLKPGVFKRRGLGYHVNAALQGAGA